MKPTIDEALKNKLPLPWKQTTCDGPPSWKVERQRPEQFTPDFYVRLKMYGSKENEIRELFCVQNENWAKLKASMGIAAKHGLAAWLADDGKPASYLDAHSPTVDSTQIPPTVNRHVTTPAGELKKIEMTDVEVKPAPPASPPFRAHDLDPDGLNYQDRHFLGLDAPHAPTADELTEIFEPEPPAGILQTAERLADLITQREHLRDEERLVAGLIGKIDKDIAECLQVIQEAAR